MVTLHHPPSVAFREASVMEPPFVCEETQPVLERVSVVQVKRVEYPWKLPEHITLDAVVHKFT